MLLFLLCWASAYVLLQLSRSWHLPPSEETVMSRRYAERLAQQRQRFPPGSEPSALDLRQYRGRVLVVCAAAAGGEHTELWLRQLTRAYGEDFPEGVGLVWLAVGSNAEEVSELARRLKLPFPAWADPAGSAAHQLDHRVDPTLYLVGKWGAARYAGELRPAQLKRMLVKLSKERADGQHQFFSSRGADAGHRAPDFTLPDLDGRPVALRSLLGSSPLLGVLFAGAELPTGPRATEWLEGVVAQAGSAQLQMCVIYSLVTPGEVRRAFTRVPPRVRVLSDESGEVARSYRAEEGPVWLIIGPRGIVRYRGDTAGGFVDAVSAFLSHDDPSQRSGSRPLPP